MLVAGLSGCLAGPAVQPTSGGASGAAAGVRPAATAPAAVQPPVEGPEPAGVPVAVIKTEKGVFKFVLLRAIAPGHVRNFVSLTNKGYFNNLTFHRVIPSILIQGGDPKGDGTGGPGYSIKAEFNDHPYVPGTVGMARTTDPDSAGSQWFITEKDMPSWVHNYTVFGQVVEGLDVVRAIQRGDRMLEVRIEYVAESTLPAGVLK